MINNFKKPLLNSIRKLFANKHAEGILIGFSKNKSPDTFIVKALPTNNLYKKGSIRVGERQGFKFQMDISDLVDWHLYFGIREFSHEQLYALCNSNHTVFDVGTNNGAVLMQLSKAANRGFVYGFEPDPTNFKRCLTNLSLNNITNVNVSQIAFGSSEGDGYLTVVDEHNRGMNKLSTSSDNGIKTEITTIDSFVSSNHIERLDLIKIDTEGFEMNILMGAEKTLRHHKPILFIELDDDNLREQGHSAQALVAFVKQLGYKVINAYNKTQVRENDNFSHCHFDIIATS